MVGIVILINAINPPSIRQGVHGVFRVLDYIPGIASYTTALSILGREDGRNTEVEVHIREDAIQQMHTVIIGLCTRGHIRTIPRIGLHAAMSHEVHLDVLIATAAKQVVRLFHHGLHSRMRRINGIGTIQVLRLAIGIQIKILILILFYTRYFAFRVLTPVRKGCPIDAWHLMVLDAAVGKILKLLFREVVPARVQSGVEQTIAIGKRPVLQLLCKEIRDAGRVVMINLESQGSP